MLFPKRQKAPSDLLPWWHPWMLMRGAWNVVFSTALGAAVGAIAADLLAQIAARISGSDPRDWAADLSWIGWAIGCFVAFVSYMAYRMDDSSPE